MRAFPAARNRWKKAIYDAVEEEVNLYNYPLEGTLNESPVYLSDLPEFLNKVKSYEFGIRDRKLFIGWAHHQLIQDPPKIALPISCLARHGITLGEPGSGKTSADLVIAIEAAEVVTQVLILDASGGVQEKIRDLPAIIRDKFRQVNIDSATAKAEINKLLETSGLSLIETSKRDAPDVFSIMMDEIESSLGSPGYQPRKINKVLLIEEAGEVLGREGKQKENSLRLVQLLDEAYRKGWCVWLSAQHPSSIADGQDMAVSILKKLKNRIILAQTSEVDTLVEVFRAEKGFTDEDESLIRSAVGSLDLGNAFCRGVELTTTEHYLPLVTIQIRRLDQDRETS